jgi:hypothetical protein
METNDFDKLFEELKAQKFSALEKEFNIFQSIYKTEFKAAKAFSIDIIRREKSLTEILINNGLYFDEFKYEIKNKLDYSFDNFKEPCAYMIYEFLPQIIEDFKKKKEDDILRITKGFRLTFDHEYFDNFKDIDAIELYSEIQACRKFNDHLILKEEVFLLPNENIENELPGHLSNEIDTEPIYLEYS